jgi:hypothetical protein
MRIMTWFRRFADHTLAADPAGWQPTPDMPPDGATSDYDVEWPHITGDDSGFWEAMQQEEERR